MSKKQIRLIVCVVLSMLLLFSGAISAFAQVDEVQLANVPIKKPVVSSIDNIGKTISGISPGTTLNEIKSNFSAAYNVTAANAGGEVQPDGILGTGTVITVKNGENVVNEYTTLVYGDVEGDGTISSLDALNMKKHLLGLGSLTGIYAQSADLDKSNGINSIDALVLALSTLGNSKIDQGGTTETVEPRPIKVLTIGDSLTDDDCWRYNYVKEMLGYGANFEMAGVDWSDARFNEFPDGDKYKANCGRGGYSVGPDNNPWGNISAVLDYYLTVDYDAVFIMMGRNDYANVTGDQSGAPNNYWNMVRRIYEDNPNATIFVSSVPTMQGPNAENPVDTGDGARRPGALNEKIPEIVNYFRGQGKDISFVDMDAAQLQYADFPTKALGDEKNDNVHPKPNGYAKIAGVWADATKDFILEQSGLTPVVSKKPVQGNLFRGYPLVDTASMTKIVDLSDFNDAKTADNFDAINAIPWWGSMGIGRSQMWGYGQAVYTAGQYTGTYTLDISYNLDFNELNPCYANVYVSYLNDNNYLLIKLIPNAKGPMSIQVIKKIAGTETTVYTVPALDSPKGGGIGVTAMMNGTKMTLGISGKVVATDIQVGEIPAGSIMMESDHGAFDIRNFRIYVPYTEEPVVFEPYSRNFDKVGTPAESKQRLLDDGWTVDNFGYTDWSNNFEAPGYGSGKLFLENRFYTGEYYLKYTLSSWATGGNIELLPSVDVKSASSTSINIDPIGQGGSGYNVVISKKMTGATTFMSTYKGSSSFTGDWTVEVYDEDGKVSIFATDGSGNKACWLDQADFDILRGNIGVKSGLAGYALKKIDVLALENAPAKPVINRVNSVGLDKTAVQIDDISTTKLTATFTPVDASNKRITWSSSDTNVATVDSNGKVVAINPGTAVITVKAEDRSMTASCEVTVVPNNVLPVIGNQIYANDFSGTTAEMATLYPDWTFNSSILDSNQFVIKPTEGSKVNLWNHDLSGNYQLKCDVDLGDANWHNRQIMFNYVDSSNYYYLDMSAGRDTTNARFELFKVKGGNTTSVYKSQDYLLQGWRTVVINQFEDKIVVYTTKTSGKEYTPLFTVSGMTDLSGKAGMSTFHSASWDPSLRFDNFVVNELTALSPQER